MRIRLEKTADQKGEGHKGNAESCGQPGPEPVGQVAAERRKRYGHDGWSHEQDSDKGR